MNHSCNAIRIPAIALLIAGAVSCSSEKKDAATAEPAAIPAAKDTPVKAEPKPVEIVANVEEAKAIFEARCVACHGSTGKGDGPGAAAITPKPRDYTDPEWQLSVADEDIAIAIVKGGLGVGKSVVMPANPDLKNKPEVVKGLIDIIRDFER